MENNWIPVDGIPEVGEDTYIDVKWSDGHIWMSGNDKIEYFDWSKPSGLHVSHWRLHKPRQQSLDDAFGLPVGVTPFVYPQTSFKPSSEAQLRSDEAARINALLSEKLSTISDIASKLTRKNFSVADIKLVKDLLESVEEYEENK